MMAQQSRRSGTRRAGTTPPPAATARRRQRPQRTGQRSPANRPAAWTTKVSRPLRPETEDQRAAYQAAVSYAVRLLISNCLQP